MTTPQTHTRADVRRIPNTPPEKLRRSPCLGRAIVKVDAEVSSVEREKDRLLVAVRFINSGRYPITLRTSDQWPSSRRYAFSIGGSGTDNKNEWSATLAGLPLANKTEFVDGKVTISAGSAVTFKFLVVPDAKVPRGTYRLNVFVVTNARAPDVIPSLGYVDFHSDRSKPATVTFDHDYPSTPGERENYEAQKREAMSSQPVYPGEQFAETGRYRLVPNAVQRSRFLQRFSAGELALGMADLAKFVGTANIEDERGQKIRVIDEGYGWVWEADSLPDVFAPDIRCDPGEPCPRSGCWFARVKSNITFFTYDDSLDEVIQCRAGQIMPTSRKFPACDRLRWEWIGA